MKFRERHVDGFFVVHSYEDGAVLSALIDQRLKALHADMEDVQYSTHITQEGRVMNDVLVMYSGKDSYNKLPNIHPEFLGED